MKLTPEQIAAVIEKIAGEEGDHEEKGPNKGTCEKYIVVGSGTPGDSWCMDLILWAIHEVTGAYPLPRSGSCEEQRVAARKRGDLTHDAGYGRIGLVISPITGRAHHAFLASTSVDDYGTYGSWAGNTNDNGGREGTGVYYKDRGKDDGNIYEYITI